jgi:hypothetical protein
LFLDFSFLKAEQRIILWTVEEFLPYKVKILHCSWA